ncbi:RNA-guided endonuclease InsQ/TnpB family protein, partial [Sulfobacillus harzensis]|uniref:RNA-guided endonuclease InsQ/TnpB family protein n=1 Tax=Sulfobacillus harzensis TaxID=2729629 RepID=UPI001A9BE1B3
MRTISLSQPPFANSQNFFAGTAAYPTFKKKGHHDRFSLTNDQFTIKGRQVHIPKLGWVRMHETLRFVGKVVEGTISRTADRWFLSVTVEIPDPPVVRRENQAVVGVDLGVSAFATLSTGEKIIGPKAYATAQKQLRRLSQHFSRQMEAAKVRAGLEPGQPICIWPNRNGQFGHRFSPVLPLRIPQNG